MRQKHLLDVGLVIMLLVALSACGGGSSKPEAALWGRWEADGGGLFSTSTLDFYEDGQLVMDGRRADPGQYVVIAPGRIKITRNGEAEIINYVLNEDTLILYYQQEDNVYTRQILTTTLIEMHPENVSGITSTIMPTDVDPAQRISSETPMAVPASQTPSSTKDFTSTPTLTITPTMAPTLGVGSRLLNTADGAEMVYIPAGTFVMGSESSAAQKDEQPQREIFLDSYWIYQNPVTNQQFTVFVEMTGYKTTAEYIGKSWIFENGSRQVTGAYWLAPEGGNSGVMGRLDHPVVHISYDDAVSYCEWAGGRLPTEAEWEKAARGETGHTYPWGDAPVTGEKANFCDRGCPMDYADRAMDDGFARTSPVGRFMSGKSVYGAQDMVGNVWEWVADWYGRNYYASGSTDNPAGPADGEYRVIRGGSWVSSAKYLRASYRNWSDPDDTSNDHGFRCVILQNP